MRYAVLPLLLATAVFANSAGSQQTSASANTNASWLSDLTPAQRALFDEARKGFASSDFEAALPKLRQLHQELPKNDIIAKFAAEAAVNAGADEEASSLLAPVLQADPNDSQALGIEAHLYGQQHEVAKRDAVMDRIQALHDQGKPGPSVVIIEKDLLPQGGSVRISDYVVPQGRYHIVLMAEFFDPSGKRTRRIALESDDIDQVRFQKEHPDQAAVGVRIYSIDSYSETYDAQGQVSGQTHGTLCPVPGCFITGRPSYELFRNTVLGQGTAGPVSSTTVPSAAK